MPIRANDKEFEDLDDPHDLEESTDSENSPDELEPELEMAGNLNTAAATASSAGTVGQKIKKVQAKKTREIKLINKFFFVKLHLWQF